MRKSKLLAKIAALDPSDEQYDDVYDSLESVLRELSVNISNYDENIYKKELAIANATSKKVTAEDVFKTMKAMVECFDYLPDEDEQKIMNGILDTVELHEKKQPNGMWVKKIRFKVPLNAPDGNVFDEVELVDENSLPKVNHDETVVLMSCPLTEHEKYGEYFMNRNVSDIMSEYSEQHDEWH